MLHKASVCPPIEVIMHNGDLSKKYCSCINGPFDTCMEGNLGATNWKVTDHSPTQVKGGAKGTKQRANRPVEASSPAQEVAQLRTKGWRPNNADRRHEHVASLMLEHSSTVNETVTNVKKCVTGIGEQLQTCDQEAFLLDRAMNIQRSWDERFVSMAAQGIPLDIIMSYLRNRLGVEDANQEVMTLQEALRRSR